MTKIIERTKTSKAPVKEPGRAWRNKYYLGAVDDLHENSSPGEFWGAVIHPSRDLAETAAQKHIPCTCKYLGAFPVPLESD